MPSQQAIKKEVKGWGGAFKQIGKDLCQTGNQFCKELDQGAYGAADEITGLKRRRY